MADDVDYWLNIAVFGFGIAVFAGFNSNANEHICMLSTRFWKKYAILQLLSVSITVAKQRGLLAFGSRMPICQQILLLFARFNNYDNRQICSLIYVRYMRRTIVKCLIWLFCCIAIFGCAEDEPTARSNQTNSEASKHHVAVETLDRRSFRDETPAFTVISLKQYQDIKAEFAQKHGDWDPSCALTYREKKEDGWRDYSLTLESFDEDYVWVKRFAHRGKETDWIARYRLGRNPQVDEEFGIQQILSERSKSIGGIKYGMSVDEVYSIKGRHFKVHRHAKAGSAYLIYDDVKVSVRGWSDFSRKGRVVGVMPITDQIRSYTKDFPYQDEMPTLNVEPNKSIPFG